MFSFYEKSFLVFYLVKADVEYGGNCTLLQAIFSFFVAKNNSCLHIILVKSSCTPSLLDLLLHCPKNISYYFIAKNLLHLNENKDACYSAGKYVKLFLYRNLFIYLKYSYLGTAVAQWLRCCATNRKFAGSIPDVVIGIFH